MLHMVWPKQRPGLFRSTHLENDRRSLSDLFTEWQIFSGRGAGTPSVAQFLSGQTGKSMQTGPTCELKIGSQCVLNLASNRHAKRRKLTVEVCKGDRESIESELRERITPKKRAD